MKNVQRINRKITLSDSIKQAICKIQASNLSLTVNQKLEC